jgi:hypothetical protein
MVPCQDNKRNIVAVIEVKNANLIIPLKENNEGKVMLSFLGLTIL